MQIIAAKKTTRIVKPIFISVDPARDTVGQIRHYAKDFHKSFVFLTGTKDMVAAATKAYRVYFSKVSSKVIVLKYQLLCYLICITSESIHQSRMQSSINTDVNSIEMMRCTSPIVPNMVILLCNYTV